MKNELLTLGNVIHTDEGVGVINELYGDELCVAIDGEHYLFDYGDIKGVAITPEWLEKLGISHEKKNQYKYRNFKIKYFEKQTTIYHGGEYIFTCHYVHQLQNLIDMWYGKIEVEL